MHYPKLKFRIISLKHELDIFKNFLSRDKNSYFRINFTNYYYQLKDYPNIDLEKFIVDKTKRNKEIFERNKKRYEKEWKTIERKFHKTLINILNTNWPRDRKICVADLSLTVIYPRYLDNYCFVVSGKSDIDSVMEICAHEITHFLYFKKFGEQYPNIPNTHYNGNHIEWVLSEILAPVILNDVRFKNLFAAKHNGYHIFYTSKIGKKTIMQIFEEKYKLMIEKNKGKFDDYLIWAYKYAKKHEKELMVV